MEEDRPLLEGRDHLFRQLYTDFHFTHLPMNLRDFDRLSMAHGVEVRSPFMDWRLVCFSFSLPSDRKIGGHYTKRILRDAMKGILPETIRTRTKKLGFPNLDEGWMSARAQEFIRDSISTIEFRTSPFWSGSRIAVEMESAFQNQDRQLIFKAWKFLQASYLMQAFKSKSERL
jgi:asparagine synthase (glutamine-hydrolysing)